MPLKQFVDLRRSSSAAAKGRDFSAPYARMRVLALPLMRTGTDSPAHDAFLARSTAARLLSSAACALHSGQITSRPTGMNLRPQRVQNFSVALIFFSMINLLPAAMGRQHMFLSIPLDVSASYPDVDAPTSSIDYSSIDDSSLSYADWHWATQGNLVSVQEIQDSVFICRCKLRDLSCGCIFFCNPVPFF